MKISAFTQPRTLSLVLFSLLLLSSCKEDTPQMMGQAGPVEVEAIRVSSSPVELLSELSGRTSAYRVAEVRPQVNGIIQKRFFNEGTDVKAGEQLYQIDPATHQASYASAKAALAKAEASEYSARLTAERYKTLGKTKAVSEIDIIDKDAAWKQALADVEAAKAALNNAKINLDYTSITAPISGVIGKSFITEGALVTAQQTSPLAIIQQLDPLYVDVTQSSLEMQRLKRRFADITGNGIDSDDPSVQIILEDGTVYGQLGTLKFSDKTVDQSTGSVTLRVVIANPSQELLPGMFVRARLSFGKHNGLLIPTASIARNRRGDPYVMLINKESTVEARVVTTGQTVGAKTLIISGLSEGDRIVTAGLQRVRPGAQVHAVDKSEAVSQQDGQQTAPGTGGE